jgi:hypothetical protein
MGGWVDTNFLGAPSVERRRRPRHLVIRSEGGSEQVAAEISFAVENPSCRRGRGRGASCHHAAQRAHDHLYLARQLSDGEIWTAHGVLIPVV